MKISFEFYKKAITKVLWRNSLINFLGIHLLTWFSTLLLSYMKLLKNSTKNPFILKWLPLTILSFKIILLKSLLLVFLNLGRNLHIIIIRTKYHKLYMKIVLKKRRVLRNLVRLLCNFFFVVQMKTSKNICFLNVH